MKSIFFFIGIFISVLSNAQQKAGIKGSIVNEKNEPIAGISIQLLNAQLPTATDVTGHFSLPNIQSGNYTLLITGIGFQAKKENIRVRENKTTSVQLQLNSANHTLEEVVFTASRFPSGTRSLTRTNTLLCDLSQQVRSIDRSVLNDQQLFQLNDALKFSCRTRYTNK